MLQYRLPLRPQMRRRARRQEGAIATSRVESSSPADRRQAQAASLTHGEITDSPAILSLHLRHAARCRRIEERKRRSSRAIRLKTRKSAAFQSPFLASDAIHAGEAV